MRHVFCHKSLAHAGVGAANASVSPEDRLSEYELKAQIDTLVFAANETTSRTLARIRDTQATGAEFESIMTEFRDLMTSRASKSIRVSNPVLQEQAKDKESYKFVTCGKEVVPLPKEDIKF